MLLVVFMIFSSFAFLISCDDDNGDDVVDGGDEDNSTTKPSNSTRPRPGQSGTVDDVPEGYLIYQTWESTSVGSFTSANKISSAIKAGATMSIINTDNYSEGATTARALRIYRAANSGTSNDSFINVSPTASKLEESYVLEFDVYVTADNATTFSVNARKNYEGNGVFNEMLRYEHKTKSFVAVGGGGDSFAASTNTWYTIAIVINDEACTYDLYIDGYLKVKDVAYTNSTFPKQSEASIDLYRITMPSGNEVSEFYLDNIAVYNGTEPKVNKGSDIPNYQYITVPEITIFEANENTDPTKYYGSTVLDNVNNGSLSMADGITLVGIAKDGTVEVLRDAVDGENKALPEGSEYYLQIANFESFLEGGGFTFPLDSSFMDNGYATATKDYKGNAAWDVTIYSKIIVELYIPGEVNAMSKYGIMLCLDCGQASDGWGYYTHYFNTNDSIYKNGFYTLDKQLNAFGASRTPSYEHLANISLKMSGWAGNCGVSGNDGKPSGNLADGYSIYIKSIKLSGGGYAIPVAKGDDENCTHVLEDGVTSAMERKTVAPTCISMGYDCDRCSICGYELLVNDMSCVKEATGHDYGTPATNDTYKITYATCATKGKSEADCLNCGYHEVIETYNELGHDYTTVIDTGAMKLKQTCTNCGNKVELAFEEKLPTYDELVAAMGKYTVIKNITNISNETVGAKYQDTTSNGSTSTVKTLGNVNFILRHRWLTIGDNEGVDGVNKYVTIGGADTDDIKGKSSHSYVDMTGLSGTDLVIQFSLRLGEKGDDGNYKHNSWDVAYRPSGRTASTFASLENDGTLTIPNTDIVYQLSDEKFTLLAFAFHTVTKTYDVYADGVLLGSGNMSIDTITESRIFNLDHSASDGFNSTFDVANLYFYQAEFPVTITGIQGGGGSNTITSFVGDILKSDFSEESDNIGLNDTAVIENNALKISNDSTEQKFVDLSVLDAYKKMTNNYTITINLEAGATVSNTVLVRGVKSNYYGQVLTEDLVTVDAEGDIFVSGMYVGNIAETTSIKLDIDEEKNSIAVSINGTLITDEGRYQNADYGNVADKTYLTGISLGCANGAYTVTSVEVVAE